MKLALVQARSVRGDVEANIAAHVRHVKTAAALGAQFVVFPELSLTGYEPELARARAVDDRDPRLAVFQGLSDELRLLIGVGLPTRAVPRPRISLVLFSPQVPPRVYSKGYLHADEEPFFSPGELGTSMMDTTPRIALAICYELSVPAHAETAFRQGAELYLCSVAKTARGVETSHARLSEIARTRAAPVLMVNAVGMSGDGDCAGGSAAWDRGGELVARLDATGEGLLLFDTSTGRAAITPALSPPAAS